MIDPNGSVDKDHRLGLRRGTDLARGSVPPIAASRWALCLAISDSSPMRTKVVFFATPVSSAAFLKTASSMSSVVLMHIIVPYLYAVVKPAKQLCGAAPFFAVGVASRRRLSTFDVPIGDRSRLLLFIS